jgi:hypothetical protein
VLVVYEANRSICGQVNSAGCMVLDDGKCGHYDYRLHVTGYEEIRDDFLSSIEEMKQISVVGVFRRGARLRRRRRSDMKQIHIYMGQTNSIGDGAILSWQRC